VKIDHLTCPGAERRSAAARSSPTSTAWGSRTSSSAPAANVRCGTLCSSPDTGGRPGVPCEGAHRVGQGAAAPARARAAVAPARPRPARARSTLAQLESLGSVEGSSTPPSVPRSTRSPPSRTSPRSASARSSADQDEVAYPASVLTRVAGGDTARSRPSSTALLRRERPHELPSTPAMTGDRAYEISNADLLPTRSSRGRRSTTRHSAGSRRGAPPRDPALVPEPVVHPHRDLRGARAWAWVSATRPIGRAVGGSVARLAAGPAGSPAIATSRCCWSLEASASRPTRRRSAACSRSLRFSHSGATILRGNQGGRHGRHFGGTETRSPSQEAMEPSTS
jgi:hypothetical protein